jgi:hypothetical protein
MFWWLGLHSLSSKINIIGQTQHRPYLTSNNKHTIIHNHVIYATEKVSGHKATANEIPLLTDVDEEKWTELGIIRKKIYLLSHLSPSITLTNRFFICMFLEGHIFSEVHSTQLHHEILHNSKTSQWEKRCRVQTHSFNWQQHVTISWIF